MKKRSILLFVVTTGMLTACSCFGINTVKLSDTTRTVFTLTDLSMPGLGEDGAANRNLIPHKEVHFKVHPSYENVLYCDFVTYAELVANTFLIEGTRYECDGTNFTISNSDGQTFFAAEVNYRNKMIAYAGNITSARLDQMEQVASLGNLLTDAKVTQNTIKQGEVLYTSVYFKDYDFPIYYQNNKLIAPLAFFDSALGSALSLYHIDGFADLVQYSDQSAIEVPITTDNKSVAQTIQAYYQQNGMPEDLRLLERESLYLIMDNFYGLAAHKHIKSMTNYYDNLAISDALLSKDEATRNYSIFEAFAVLNDDHSGITKIAPHWGDKAEYSHRGPLSVDRRLLSQSLVAERNATWGTTPTDYGVDEQVRYSTSGETAYFYFDSFIFDRNLYKQENRDNLWHTDSYFYFLHQFEAIKAHGGVKNVIIDDSCNGGGTIGIAVKLLALISKDNHGSNFTYNLKTGTVSELAIQVDSNQDGQYDQDDVYGDDFNIYILTSPNSFSCGNILPVSAQFNGLAKIIGKKSGGGECVVGSNQLPSGRSIVHSSIERIVLVKDGKVYYGVENGATPDIELEYHQFYNLDHVETVIKEANQ